MSGITLRELQTNLTWAGRYSRDFRANPQPHKDFAHALLHVLKASGKLAVLVDELDHDPDGPNEPTRDPCGTRELFARFLADLVYCALRLANTFPGGVVDLESAVLRRIEEKNSRASPAVLDPVPPVVVYPQRSGKSMPSHAFDFVGTGPRRYTIDGLREDDSVDRQNAETD